jgi:hypothetical protein
MACLGDDAAMKPGDRIIDFEEKKGTIEAIDDGHISILYDEPDHGWYRDSPEYDPTDRIALVLLSSAVNRNTLRLLTDLELIVDAGK